MSVLVTALGWPAGTGLASNLAASAICVGSAYLKLKAQHRIQHTAAIISQKKIATAQRSHADALHAERMEQASRHQRELLERAEVQHEALKAHVAATLAGAR